MAILPASPRIALRIPNAIHAGSSFVALVEIAARTPVKLDWIDARLRTTERCVLAATAESRTETLVALDARLFEGGVLDAGTHSLRARFELPVETAPSMTHALATIETQLAIQASIPWWPDARATYVIPVRAAPRTLEPAPYRAVNQTTGSDAPRVELSLASRAIAARGVISGAVAFFHRDPRAIAGAQLTLRASARLRSRSGHGESRSAPAYTIPLPASIRGDGTPVPFAVRVPDDVTPSFASRSVALEWELAVERRGLFAMHTWLVVPIEIVETGDVPDRSERLEVPPIGDARLAAMFAAVAASEGLGQRAGELTGAEGAVSFRIRRAASAGTDTTLIAELVLPRIGIGLSVEPDRMLAGLIHGDVAIGDAPFDRAYRVQARDPEQARAFLTGLTALFADGALTRLDDHFAVLTVSDPALDPLPLVAFVARVRAFARAIEDAIARVPPPTGFDADPAAWAEVARALGGRAVLGELSVAGRIGESEVAIDTRLATHEHLLRVRPSPSIPGDVELTMEDPRAAPPRALAEALLALPAGARGLEIVAGEARLRLALPHVGGRTRSDPRGALRAASLLSRLGTLLAPARGPFR